jgi:uncharacterized protein YggU (UPF0235/DUF167 family)
MRIKVLVRPGRKESGVFPPGEFEKGKCDFIVNLKARAQGGLANRELLFLMKRKFGKNAEIVAGATSRLKLIELWE